jgi:hypothetical protein
MHENQTGLSKTGQIDSANSPRLATVVKSPEKGAIRTANKFNAILTWAPQDISNGRYRTMLYRFLTNHVPIISACVWTWVRLSAAPGEFKIVDARDERAKRTALERLKALSERVYANAIGNRVGLATMLPELFVSLFRDGIFGGFITVNADGSGIDRVIPVDSLIMSREQRDSGPGLFLDLESGMMDLDRADFRYIALSNSPAQPFGTSILQSIPLVTYIEQQLVSDMQRSSHNSGYHRLHIKITPPARMAGESDNAYTNRINGYFDSTVQMIRSCEVDDNPVTWDNVAVEYIGPNSSSSVSTNWFVSHRAMIEDICAGTNLAPYLLGYSYGATTTWSNFKFDVVMRQVRSVQAEVANFLEWIANIDLALAGIDASCRFVFDNSFAYQATDQVAVESKRVENLLKLYQAGLIDEKSAREKVGSLI